MKSALLTLAAAVLVAGSAHAQKLAAAQVPAATVATFKMSFPAVKTVKWEKEGADYKAGFEMGKAEMSAVITVAGLLKETETEMAVAHLPASVQKTLAANYKTSKIKEASRILTAATGVTTYEAEISQGGKTRDVLFNADGSEIKK